MRHTLLLVAVIGLSVLSIPAAQSPAQTPGPAPAAPGLECNGTRILDPFPGPLAGADLPPGLLPIKDDVKSQVLRSGLPCQENVSTGAQGDPAGKEVEGLQNLQRGFDYYSWRTFLALNSPADGTPIEQAQADTPTLWEDMNSFKQLLDVMLPTGQPLANWPPDKAGMDAERERLVPEQCKPLHKEMPTSKIVQMIEESFNEPFKTGPLIDQAGRYAIFDILMNREMFGYMRDHKLTTKAGQAANTDLSIDFPAGQNTGPNANKAFGAFLEDPVAGRGPGEDLPYGGRPGADAAAGRPDLSAALPARKAGPDWLSRGAQNRGPSAVDLDFVRACPERAGQGRGRR
jgi:hypothetical protein